MTVETGNMHRPFFSIIIPTLNEAKYISGILNDLEDQTFRDFEVIVVDGKSKDRTREIAQSYKSNQINPIVIESTVRHVCAQRNLGSENARGVWLIFMDADDRLPPFFLQGIKYHLESDPADIATTFIAPDRKYKQSRTIVQAMNIAIEMAKNTKAPLINEGMFITTKKTLDSLGGFDINTHYAEGRRLLEKAKELGLTYQIYKDPAFEYSMRRIHKYGLLKITSSLAKYEISRLLSVPMTKLEVNKLYPMEGGSIADMPYERRHEFQNKIQSFLSQLKSPVKNKAKLKKLLAEITQNQLQ